MIKATDICNLSVNLGSYWINLKPPTSFFFFFLLSSTSPMCGDRGIKASGRREGKKCKRHLASILDMGREKKKRKKKRRCCWHVKSWDVNKEHAWWGRERERVKVDIILHCVQLIYCSSFFFWKGGWSQVNTFRSTSQTWVKSWHTMGCLFQFSVCLF